MVSNPFISILLACRVGDNANSKLPGCIASLVEKAKDTASFEILIKFDDDDKAASTVKDALRNFPISIRTITTPRGRGYVDLHKAYMDLLMMAAPSSDLFWVISDDIEISTPQWDQVLLEMKSHYQDRTCVLHARRIRDLAPMDWLQAIETDAYPIWSRKWLASAGFGYTFSTDGWTSYLEYLLFGNHGIDNRVEVRALNLKRHINPATDLAGSDRWNRERKDMLDLMQTPHFLSFANEVVLGIAARIAQEVGQVPRSLATRGRWWLRSLSAKKKKTA